MNANVRWGGLELGDVLGRGGSGSVVYAATDPTSGAARAVKVVDGLDDAARHRLLREVAVAARVTHPGLVEVLDSGETDGAVWIALSRVDGPDLQREVEQRGPLEPAEALDLLIQVGKALAALHDAGVVHRDVTPANVLIEGRRGERRARLTDAGLAHSASESTALSIDGSWAATAQGGDLVDVSGTAAWMAPEQWRGADVTPAGDVYAAGALLHWLLTGQRPFAGATLPQLAASHTLGARPVPSQVRAELPPLYDALVARLTAVDPADRPADGAALVEALDRVRRGDEVAVRPAPRRGRRRVLIGAAAAVVVAGGVTAWALMSREPAAKSSGGAVRTVCARELSLRDEPKAGSTQLRNVPRGDRLTILSADDGWARVRTADGTEAWVLTQYLCRK